MRGPHQAWGAEAEGSPHEVPRLDKLNMSAPPHLSHHAKYYFDDEISIFLVEDTLFKVHRHFLTRESDVFRSMFASPSPPDGPDGVSDARPIPLPGVNVCEFERLLDSFYQGAFRPIKAAELSEPLLTTNNQFFEKWIDLLSIATRFDFKAIRERAIDAIERRKPRLEPIEQICLAEKHDIPQWLTPAFELLCQRNNPLEIHEAERIGLRYATLLARAREEVRDSFRVRVTGWGGQGGQGGQRQLWIPEENLPYDRFLVAQIVQEVFFPSVYLPLVPSDYH